MDWEGLGKWATKNKCVSPHMSSGVLILTFFTIGNGLQITGHRNRTRRCASFLTLGCFDIGCGRDQWF